MAGLTLNAMLFKHSQYPNAAKAFLQFMLEKDQYEPWLNANSGYWSQPLAAYAEAAVWSEDPKVEIFKDTMNSTYYDGYKGPISTATGAVRCRLRDGADVRSGGDRRLDAGGRGRGSRAACEAVFPAAGPVTADTDRSSLRGAIDTPSFRDGAQAPDLESRDFRCAIAHRVRCFASPRNDTDKVRTSI